MPFREFSLHEPKPAAVHFLSRWSNDHIKSSDLKLTSSILALNSAYRPGIMQSFNPIWFLSVIAIFVRHPRLLFSANIFLFLKDESLIYSFIQIIWLEFLLCARDCPRHLGYICTPKNKDLCPHGIDILVGEDRQ